MRVITNLKLVVMLEYRNMKVFLQEAVRQIAQKKFLKSKLLKKKLKEVIKRSYDPHRVEIVGTFNEKIEMKMSLELKK